MFDKLSDRENLEKAIREKYGEEAVQNLKNDWNSQKEEVYKEQVLKIVYKDSDFYQEEKREKFIIKTKINYSSDKNCALCNKYIYKRNDFYWYLKFDTCEDCYIQYIEGRETKWQNQKIQEKIH